MKTTTTDRPFIINEMDAIAKEPYMPEHCPRGNCMMVYDKRRCYACSSIGVSP